MANSPRRSIRRLLTLLPATFLLFSLPSCDGDNGLPGNDGAQGPPGESTDTQLGRRDLLPGLNISVVSLSGGSFVGDPGHFKVGDKIKVTFTVKKDDGTDIPIENLDALRAIVAGPTSNYNALIERQNDVASAAVDNGDGTYTYTFPVRIPATYPAPLNDTTSFGALEDEWQGLPLVAGTYTIGLEGYRYYNIEDVRYRDAGNLTHDFLLGNTATLVSREVSTNENCFQCHTEFRAHGGSRRDLTYCLLCHTSGAEDRNSAGAAGGSPGVSIDFSIMIHKIHNGEHLPSVNGVATNANGSRNYDATPQPYQVVGYSDSIHDYSHIAFPAWPSLSYPTARDFGYSSLTGPQQDQEDMIRTGVISCDMCHGDPDGDGPLPAPAQGDLAYTNPQQHTCQSCHDDVDWDLPYTSNGVTMPAQANNEFCAACHPETGAWSVRDSHTHPLFDSAVNPGLNFTVTSVDEAGTNDGDGTFDPGEKVQVSFTIEDDAGNPVAATDLNSFSVVVAGPVENRNILLSGSVPRDGVGAGPNYVSNIPVSVDQEFLGVSANDAAIESFTVDFPSIWSGSATVWLLSGTSGGSALSAAGESGRNFVDAVAGGVFARDDVVVLDPGGAGEEYHEVAHVDGNRVFFQDVLDNDQLAGASIDFATLTELAEGVDYTLDGPNGVVSEFAVASFPAGSSVLASYTGDWVVPAAFPAALNDSPDLDATWGEWSGLPMADGTYTVALWGYQTVTHVLSGETNTYRWAAEAASQDVLFGDAATLDDYTLIDSDASCLGCHQQLMFHGAGRRGYLACVLCHGTAGSEDRPQYVAGNAPATEGTPIEFRHMLHKIHMGGDLSAPEDFLVIGYGPGGYPDNWRPHTYEHVVFPTFVGGVKECNVCHGDSNSAWIEPADRSHPTSGAPARSWRNACTSCHDAAYVEAHADVNTSMSGVESCAVCHDATGDYDVELMHRSY
jgi:hypothetical protein